MPCSRRSATCSPQLDTGAAASPFSSPCPSTMRSGFYAVAILVMRIRSSITRSTQIQECAGAAAVWAHRACPVIGHGPSISIASIVSTGPLKSGQFERMRPCRAARGQDPADTHAARWLAAGNSPPGYSADLAPPRLKPHQRHSRRLLATLAAPRPEPGRVHRRRG